MASSIAESARSREQRSYSVPALARGLELLEILSGASDGLTQSALAMRSGRTISENFRSLFCLEENGYVSRGADDRFRLTMKMFTLAHRYPPSRRVIDAALPEMHALSEQVRQSCHLAVEEEGELLILAQVESPAEVGINVRVGTRRTLVATASGRVILAQGGPERRAAALTAAGVTPDSVAGRLALDRIEQIARLGFESVVDDTLTGIVDLSRPIFDLNGACIAALTIPFLSATGRDNRLEETLELLSAATVADSRRRWVMWTTDPTAPKRRRGMTRPVLRVAVRRFGPFESAIRKQFAAFCDATGRGRRYRAGRHGPRRPVEHDVRGRRPQGRLLGYRLRRDRLAAHGGRGRTPCRSLGASRASPQPKAPPIAGPTASAASRRSAAASGACRTTTARNA